MNALSLTDSELKRKIECLKKSLKLQLPVKIYIIRHWLLVLNAKKPNLYVCPEQGKTKANCPVTAKIKSIDEHRITTK